jgi:hypothetical protein|nr:MAG TPA: toxin [Caudoviricetes sp.]
MAIVKIITDERNAIMTWHEIDHFTTSFNGTGTVVIRSFANGATYADEVKARQAGDSTKDLSLNTFSVQIPEGTEISKEAIEKELLKKEYFREKSSRQIWDFEENKAKQV